MAFLHALFSWSALQTRKQSQLTIVPCVPSHAQLPRPCLSASCHPRLHGYSPLQPPCADLVRKSRSNTAPARPLHQPHGRTSPVTAPTSSSRPSFVPQLSAPHQPREGMSRMPAKLAIKAHGPEGKGVGYSGSLKKEEKLFPKDRKEDSEQKRKRGRVYLFLSRLRGVKCKKADFVFFSFL